MKKMVLGAVAGLVSMASVAAADVLVQYNANTGNSLTAAGVTVEPLTRGPGLIEEAAGTFNSSGWTVGGSEATAVAAGDFLSFGFTSSTGYSLSAMQLSYVLGLNGPSMISVLVSVDDFATSQQVFLDVGGAASGTAPVIDLTGLGLTNVTDFDVRIVGWAAGDESGTLDIQDQIEKGRFAIVIEGEVVPVPAALPLFAAGLGALGAMRARRRKAAAAA